MKKKKPVCKKCKIPASANANFCAFCGKPFDPTKKLCPHCAAELDPRGSFCGQCGHPKKTTEELLKKAFEKDGATEIKVGR
jgi:predicted amidophosphoribosyltransferase